MTDDLLTRGPDNEALTSRGAYAPPLDRLDRAWLHLFDPDATDPTVTAEPPHPEGRFIAVAASIDAFVEAFDAHDVEGVLALLADDVDLPGLGDDRDGLVSTLGRCWDERPHAVLTRGILGEDELVAVLWDVDDPGWKRVGLLTFQLDDEAEAIAQIEYVGDDPVLDEVYAEPPDEDPPEGARWREWDEGA